MAAVKGPPAKGPTLLVAQTDAFKAFLRSSKIKEALTKVLLDLYEHGPPQAADALGHVVKQMGLKEPGGVRVVKPPHPAKQNFLTYLSVSDFPKALSKALLELYEKYTQGQAPHDVPSFVHARMEAFAEAARVAQQRRVAAAEAAAAAKAAAAAERRVRAEAEREVAAGKAQAAKTEGGGGGRERKKGGRSGGTSGAGATAAAGRAGAADDPAIKAANAAVAAAMRAAEAVRADEHFQEHGGLEDGTEDGTEDGIM